MYQTTRQLIDTYTAELRDAQREVGKIRRKISLLQRECRHDVLVPEGNDLATCADCAKVFSV